MVVGAACLVAGRWHAHLWHGRPCNSGAWVQWFCSNHAGLAWGTAGHGCAAGLAADMLSFGLLHTHHGHVVRRACRLRRRLPARQVGALQDVLERELTPELKAQLLADSRQEVGRVQEALRSKL